MSETCPFCSPEGLNIITESALVRAIWDPYPVSDGHALIVPKRHVSSWFDVTDEEHAAVATLLSIVKKEIDRVHGPVGYNLGVNDGAAAGQTVSHAHLHVIPRYAGDVSDPTGGIRNVIPGRGHYLTPSPWPDGRNIGALQGGALVSGAPHDPLFPRLVQALNTATRVDILAAFVLHGGVKLIVEHLDDVLERGGQVRVLTGDYFEVTEPGALRRLLDLEGNFEVRVIEAGRQAFHPKAYVISDGADSGVAFVGSSNLSKSALLDGIEWNYRVLPSDADTGFDEIVSGFSQLWNDPRCQVVDEAWILQYEARRRQAPVRDTGVQEEVEAPPQPHDVQVAALTALEETRDAGNTAGLVVLATGLGKTWLSAFDTKSSQFKKILFIAHREEILRQAMKTFRRIRPNASMGTYSGESKDTGVDVLFASIQTLSKARHLHRFDPHEFDYVIVDEFHHAAAKSYRRLIGYFEPRFLLGLTATPERTDGADLLALCGDNLVFRADLSEGIARDLLAPFDYYGVPDLVDYDNIPWRSRRFDPEVLATAVETTERARNALEQLEKFGAGRTLAFCVSQTHADFMADFFTGAGLRAASVHSGETSAPRAHSLERLQDGTLDVICSVDMFNEGVDLPELNTILMLRPTDSRVLWLQQFGRGLRHKDGKRLKVIDYIGNHRSFLTKTQALLGLGNSEREIAYALEQLDAGEWELPPGCTVTYELEAKDILLSLIPKGSAGARLEDYYRQFREVSGVRPLASQALLDGFSPRSTRRSGLGSWLDFVEFMGDLSAEETQVYDRLNGFLGQLEVTKMTKSYKMVVLLAMLGAEALPGQISIEHLVERFADIVRRYSPLRREVGDVLENPAALRRLLQDHPLNAWTGTAAMGGTSYFEFDGKTFSSQFTVPDELSEVAGDLIREIVEWRLFEYIRRAGSRPGSDQVVCRVSQSGGRPILFLPSRDKVAGVPTGWTDVLVDDQELQANFVKIAVNVLTERGGTENLLPALLRRWFGEDAGQPGTAHQVLFQMREGVYVMTPVDGTASLPKGPTLWRRYTRVDAFDAVGVTATGREPQQGVVARPDKFVFFVTLDKTGKDEAHQYKDKLLSPSEFQWQTQNRTARDSARGQRYQAQKHDDLPVHLFVRRTAKTGSRTNPFLYAGQLRFLRWEGDKPITIWWKFEADVPEELWEELEVEGGITDG